MARAVRRHRRCRAEHGNGDEKPSLTRTHTTTRSGTLGRRVAGPGALGGHSLASTVSIGLAGSVGHAAGRRRATWLHAATSGSRSVDGGVVRTAPGVRNPEQADAGHADGLVHRDVAAAACDGAAVERGRCREAGVLMVARQGEARVVRMDTSAYVWAVLATRTKAPQGVLLRTRISWGRLTPLGIYIMSLATDPIRGNHRLDPDTTSSAALIS